MERKSTRQTDQPKPAQKPRQKQAQQPKPAQAQTQKSKPAQEASKPKPKQASKPTQASKSTQKRKSGQTAPPLSAYEARKKAEEARKQADLARIIQELNDINNASSEPIPYPEDKDTGKGANDLSAPKIAKGCLTAIILGILFTYALGRYVHKQDERKRAAMEIPANKDANHQGTDIAYPWGYQAGAPEAPGRPTNTPSAAAPADTITVSYQDYLLYQSLHNRYGVELDLGHGISIQTGLDESEIMDQIAADGDIYSLTDYFDEYVGD